MRIKKFAISIILLAFLGVCLTSQFSARGELVPDAEQRLDSSESVFPVYEGEGFDSPEAAVLFFLDGLKKLNIEQMLGAYAWETRVSHYSMETQFRKDKTFTTGDAWLPGDDSFTHQLNLETMRVGEAVFITSSLNTFMLAGSRYASSSQMIMVQEKDIQAYLDQFNLDKLEELKQMTNILFFAPQDMVGRDFFSERRLALIEQDREIYGADEICFLPTVADVGARKLILAPTVLRYGDKWYLFSLNSRVMNYFSKNIVTDEDKQYGGFICMEELPFNTILGRKADESLIPEKDTYGIRYESKGFATPEEAVEWYLEGLKKLDINQMLQAFAWETIAVRYDLAEQIRYSPIVNKGISPAVDETDALTNLYTLRAQQIMLIYQSFERYMIPDYWPPEKGEAYMRRLKDEDIDSFLEEFHKGKLDELKQLDHIRFIPAEELIPGMNFDEEYADHYARMNARFGADETRDIIAVADVGYEHLFVAPTVARYGDKWYMVNLNSEIKMLLGGPITSLYTRGFAYGIDFPISSGK